MVTQPATGSPTAVTHRRLPQNVACGFLALRSSDDGSQHCVLLQPCIGQAELWTLAFAAVLSRPVDMTGMFLSLHRGPLPPCGWRSCCPRSVHRLLAASPWNGLSPSPRTLRQSDGPGVIRSSSLRQLGRPSKPRLHPWALPCSPTIRCPQAVGTHPGSIAAASPERLPRCCLPRRGSGSAPAHPINFGALSPIPWCSGLRAPCLRFAVCVTAPDARLGT